MKTFRHHLLLGAIASLSLLFGSARADDAVEIKQHWNPGKTYSFTLTMNQETNLEIGGQKVQQKMDNTTEMSAKVLSEGGKQHLIMKYDRIVMNMNMGAQSMKYDSKKPDDTSSPMAGPLGALAGKEFKMLLNDQGEPVDIENWDEVSAAFGGLGGMISKDSIMQAMKQGMLQAMPGHPVKPGDQWPLNVSMEMAALGKLSVSGNLTLRSVGMHDGVRCAEIATDAKLSLQQKENGDKDASSPLAAMKMKIDDSSMAGTTWFDLGLGMTRDAEFNQTMKMMMNDPTDPTKSVTVPLKQVIHMKLTKVEDTK